MSNNSRSRVINNELQCDKNVAKKSYQRRKIESNWEKYDTDDLEQYHRAASFNEVLDRNIVDGKRFQLKDEISWGDAVRDGGRVQPQPAAGSDPTVAEDDNMLHIDLRALALAQMCIPLHDRLGTTYIPHLISTELKSKFESEASRNTRQYSAYISSRKVGGNSSFPGETGTDSVTKAKVSKSQRPLISSSSKRSKDEAPAGLDKHIDDEEEEALDSFLENLNGSPVMKNEKVKQQLNEEGPCMKSAMSTDDKATCALPCSGDQQETLTPRKAGAGDDWLDELLAL